MTKKRARVGERRWPMAAAVLLAGVLRLFLPTQLRLDDARPVALVVLAALMIALIAGDPGRWMAGGFVVSGLLILLLNARPIWRAFQAWRFRAHPERAPREAASLWYAKMLRVLARRGWRKTPSQTPQDFAATIKDPLLQKTVTAFTRSYEAARFGESIDDAKTLPAMLEAVSAAKRN